MKVRLLLISVFALTLSTGLIAQENLSKQRKAAIDSLALEKVRDLSKYISIIGSKDTPFSEANRVIDRTLELFMPDAKIGVSSLYREGIKEYTIRQYLERLMALNYDKISITWYNITYISDLELQPDGRYVGVITIFQKFEAKTGDELVYKDIAQKDITIYVERKQTQISGKLIDFWDVLLGDIEVKETMPY
jgi:hypothetical protein